jgi:GH43 family beta-xylosidase
VSKSRSLLDQGVKIKVWEDKNYRSVFAPELHFVRGKWYIYFCAGAKSHEWKRKAVVLEADTSDPQGSYTCRGVLFTGEKGQLYGANDFTVMEEKGQLYAFFGAFDDPVRSVMAVRMDSPTAITEDRVPVGLLAEGPRILRHGGKIILTGAGGGFSSKSYCLKAQVWNPAKGGLTDKEAWDTLGVLFKTTDEVWGPSRAAFVPSADGKETWMVYHSKIFPADRNGFRQVNIKPIAFSADGLPLLGAPPSPFEFLPLPSGDPGLGEVYQAEEATFSGGTKTADSERGFQGGGYATGFEQPGAAVTFTVKVPAAGVYLATLRYASGEMVAAEQQSYPKMALPKRETLSIRVNGKHLRQTAFDRTTDFSHWMNQAEQLPLEAGENAISYRIGEGDTGGVNLDYLAISGGGPAFVRAGPE